MDSMSERKRRMSGSETAETDTADGVRQCPPAVRVAAVGAVGEGVALTAGAVIWLVALVTRGSSSVGVVVFLVLFALGLAVALAGAARALLRGSARARGPIVTWQLLQAATAVAILQVPARPTWLTVVGAVALVVALVVAAAALTPRATAFTTR